jgi:NAD(P)-dependent dehydrogenase (short-subunit alcohol dehydrogenase family)
MTQSELISKRLDRKIAVVTGSSGIGLAAAQRFVQEGAYTFIFARRQSEVDAAVKDIGKNVTGVQGDVSTLADLDRLYDMVK